MEKYSFVYEIETEDLQDIAEDLKARFQTSSNSHDDNRPLPIGKNKFIGIMKMNLKKNHDRVCCIDR